MENTNEFNRVLVAGCACVITSLLTYEEIERYLARSGNIYGTFLQLKDVIEVVIKLPVLIGMAWGKTRDIAGREVYEKKLSRDKLALGKWVEAADAIKKFYGNELIKKSQNALPQALMDVLSGLHTLVEKNKLTTCRNKQLAHGALALEDSEEFKQKTIRVIQAVTVFLKEKQESLSSISKQKSGFKTEAGPSFLLSFRPF